jgi:hypothetical protein
METAVATPAVPFPLRDVEDLHDADLDGVLADRLLDAGMAAASASMLAGLVSGPEAVVVAHTLSARAVLLVR